MASDSIRQRSRDALHRGDLGDELEEGFFLKDLGAVHRFPDRSKGEVETVDPIEKIRRKGLKDREELVGKMAAGLMDYYINELNNTNILNPIRDGIPACKNHPFPVGCVHGCQEGVSRIMHQSLGDVFEWVKALIQHNYEALLIRRPELRGFQTAII